MTHFLKKFAHLQTKITNYSKTTHDTHRYISKNVGKVWSVRVGINHRAIATEIEDGFLWVWIGLHAEYDKLIA